MSKLLRSSWTVNIPLWYSLEMVIYIHWRSFITSQLHWMQNMSEPELYHSKKGRDDQNGKAGERQCSVL
jgi:hypothetical protein